MDVDRTKGFKPFLIIANVGTTNTGAIDDIPRLLAISRSHSMWLHADAAYGGFFRLASGGPELMPDIEECDSITLDPHKGMFLPYGTGCLLVLRKDTLKRTHSMDAEYLHDVRAQTSPNFSDLSPELSRDFRGLRIWLPLVLHGVAAFQAAIEEKLMLTRWAYDQLKDDPRFEILDEPQLSVIAFRLKAGRRGFGPAQRGADEPREPPGPGVSLEHETRRPLHHKTMRAELQNATWIELETRSRPCRPRPQRFSRPRLRRKTLSAGRGR